MNALSHLYTETRWRKARARFLAEHPLCQCPNCDEGRVRATAADTVDHDKPHRGDLALFWDESNWRAMAKRCHDSFKQRAERSGRRTGCDVNGNPTSPGKHWK